jgi:hypothetical protein
MRTNKQIHREVTKYFYENRVLFMLAARDKSSQMLSNEYMSRYYETLAVMSPQTRRLFTKVEVMVAHFSEQTFTPRRYQHVPSVADPMQHALALLPNLATVVISLGPTPLRPLKALMRVALQRNQTLEWLLAYIPGHVEILWDQSTVSQYRSPPKDGRRRKSSAGSLRVVLVEIMHSERALGSGEDHSPPDWRKTTMSW